MRSLTFLTGLAITATLLGTARAADPIVLPDSYLIGRSAFQAGPTPAGTRGIEKSASIAVERQAGAGIDGAFWAEIFPVFNQGAAGNTSYFRLGAGASASTFHVMIVGSPSGNNYGEGDIPVPAHASPQYALSDLLMTTGAGALSSGDTGYSVYIQNPALDSFYQTVIYNGTNQFFEDVTICPSGASVEGGRSVSNVHSSVLTAFPSTIYLHNTVAMQASYSVRMYDSRTGTLLATLPNLTAEANSTYAIPESYFESQMHVSPNANQQHVTLEFHATTAFAQQLGDDPDPTDIGAIIGSAVLNSQFGAVLNLSNKCSVNR